MGGACGALIVFSGYRLDPRPGQRRRTVHQSPSAKVWNQRILQIAAEIQWNYTNTLLKVSWMSINIDWNCISFIERVWIKWPPIRFPCISLILVFWYLLIRHVGCKFVGDFWCGLAYVCIVSPTLWQYLPNIHMCLIRGRCATFLIRSFFYMFWYVLIRFDARPHLER